MKARESELLNQVPGLIHGFGTRAEPVPLKLEIAWEETKPRWKQVHGTAIAELQEPAQDCGEVDALFTMVPGLTTAVVTADCVPILLARRSGGAAAAVHAGWRGTRGHILTALWEALAAQGEKPRDWVAAVGPAIGPCCYEVSTELARDFVKEFHRAGAALVQPSPRMLDLPAINAWELRSLGLAQVDCLRACTRCSGAPGSADAAFHSYRREGSGTRQWSMIMPGPSKATSRRES